MGRLAATFVKAMVYASAASFLGVLGVVAVLWMKGHLTSDRAWNVLAAAYGVDQPAPVATQNAPSVQVSYEDVLERRAILSLDIDLRQKALDKAMEELMSRQSALTEDRNRYNRLLEEFEQRLATLQRGATDRAIQDVKQTLMAMRPEQAKAQLLKMWQDNQRDALIAILKTMPNEARKRILNEFTETEVDQLYELVKSTLSGSGEGDLIKAVQQQVDQFKKSQP